MPTVIDRDTDVVTSTSDSGPGTFIAVILGLVVVAIIGYMIYAFNSSPSTTDIHNTTITQPAAPSPTMPTMPDTSAPAPSSPAPAQ